MLQVPKKELRRINCIFNRFQNQLGGGEGTVGIYGTITTTGVAATLVALRGIPTGHVDIPSCLTDIGSGLGRPLLLAIDFDEAFGIEIDPAKCLKAKAFIPRCYKELTARNLINYRREKIRPTVCADVQNILKLPFCTHVYSFWEGFNEENKRDVGKLLRRSPYVVGIAIVQRACREPDVPAFFLRNYCFPRTELFTDPIRVKMTGSSQSFWAYILRRL
ncbi:hypothetical protein Ndes2526A_g05061 [Nannochloris sp. 'desiccata']